MNFAGCLLTESIWPSTNFISRFLTLRHLRHVYRVLGFGNAWQSAVLLQCSPQGVGILSRRRHRLEWCWQTPLYERDIPRSGGVSATNKRAKFACLSNIYCPGTSIDVYEPVASTALSLAFAIGPPLHQGIYSMSAIAIIVV